MSDVGQRERKTQARVVKLFREQLGYDLSWHTSSNGINDRFVSLMDRHLPQWRQHRKILNEAPLGHADWTY